MNITEQQYWKEIESLAECLIEDARESLEPDCQDNDCILERILDEMLIETIDGHEWVIYYAYNLDVYRISPNGEYMLDVVGEDSAAETLKSNGLSGLHMALAYWAMYADVYDKVTDLLE